MTAPTGWPWWHHAACRHLGPDLFHPEKGPGSMTDYTAALAVCADCPVRANCLHDQLTSTSGDSRFDLGVWGGTSVKERRRIRKDPTRLRFIRLAAQLERADLEAVTA